MRKLTALSLIAALGGGAIAQSPAKQVPAAVVVPPAPIVMPTDIPKMGDPDAVCFMASAQMAAIIGANQSGTAEQQQNAMRAVHGQIALYAGRLTGRLAEGAAQDQSARAAKAWVNAPTSIDKRPLIQWCMSEGFKQTNAFQVNLNPAYKMAEDLVARGRGDVKLEALDPDVLCLVLIGAALPGTAERAMQDQKARLGMDELQASQNFYISRILMKERKTKLDQSIAEALLYTGTIMKDEAMTIAKVRACTDQYASTRVKLFQAAAKGAAPDAPPVKPKG
jgi:hypothetical protein